MARAEPFLRWQRGVIEAVLVLSPVVLSGVGREPVELPKALVISIGAVLILGLWLYRTGRRGRLELVVGWLPLATVVFLTAALAASAGADSFMRGIVGPYSRWSGLASYVAYAVIALGVVDAYRDRSSLTRLRTAILGGGGVVISYALLQAVGVDPLPWDRIYGDAVFATHGNPNFASAHMGLVVPLAVAVGLQLRTSPARRVGAAVLVIGALVAQGATRSLQGWFAAAAGTWLVVLVWLGLRRSAGRRVATSSWIGAGALAAAVAALGLLGVGPMSDIFGETLEVRRWYWEAAGEMFSSNPVTGVGFGHYGLHYRMVRPSAALEALGSSTVDAAHSVPIGMFAEGGALTGVAYLGVVGIVLVGLVVGLLRTQGWERLQLAGFGGAWLAYQAQSLVSIDVPQLGVAHWAIAGAIAASSNSVASTADVGTPRAAGRLLMIVAGLATVAGLVLVTLPYRADRLLGEGMGLDSSQAGPAEALIEQGTSLAPWESAYWLELGHVQSARDSPQSAVASYERSLVADPRYWDGTIFAAWTRHALGDFEEAARWWERAFDLDPQDAEVRVEASSTYLALGQPSRAAELLEFALGQYPRRADWWLLLADVREAQGDAEAAAAARGRASEIDPAIDTSG